MQWSGEQYLELISCSVYEKLQATRAKVAPVNLIYGSPFSATEATRAGKNHDFFYLFYLNRLFLFKSNISINIL